MTKDNVIAVIKGRHILHETVLPTFVQNDTYIAGGIGKNGEEAMDVDEELPFAIGREKSIVSSYFEREVAKLSVPDMQLLLTGPNGETMRYTSLGQTLILRILRIREKCLRKAGV